MRRLEAVDRLLLAILVPLWCVTVALHVREIQRTGSAQVPVFAAPDFGSDGHPTVGGFRLERDSAGTGLEIGDRLLRVGDADLRGAGYFGFDALAFDQAGTSLETTLIFERDGIERQTVLTLRPSESPWARIPFSLSFALLGILVLLRAPPTSANRCFSVGCLCLVISETPFEGGTPAQTYAAYALFYGFAPVALFFLTRWLLRFPEEVPSKDRLPGFLPWIAAALFLLARVNYLFGGPLPTGWSPQAALFGDLLLVLLITGILVHNTRKAEPVGRRRVKWMLFGFYLSLVPMIVGLVAPLAGFDFARYDQLHNITLIMSCLLPAGMLVAILQFGLFDIDRLIGTTVTATVVVALVVGAIATVVPLAASSLGSALGLDPELGRTALSAVLAAAAVPTHQWLRPQVDRLFFIERHALENGVAELLVGLAATGDAAGLNQHVGEELCRLLRPDVCVVYVRDGESYSPAFAAGPGVPPAFEATGPLIRSLGKRSTPLAMPRGSRAKGLPALGPFERAALETLGAEVVVPVRRGEDLLAFLCLGPKGSRDVYTPTDLSLLMAVAEKASGELLRFEQEEVIRSGQVMQASLRRYVPGAVAEELASGTELASQERSVTVLFVDIRGYTSFSQTRAAEEVFSTINRYTAAVSNIVRGHGGHVVEFNGDGMMVIFGAPKTLAHKEQAAVRAALEVVSGVEELGSGDAALAVGVGIATGDAFVGNIQAADRMIWTAIGNSVNLAARLEALTRELDAAVVIDDTTRREAGPAAAAFERCDGVRIRGRSDEITVHHLPLSAAGTGDLVASAAAPAPSR